MPPQVILPKRIDMTAMREAHVTTVRRRAIVQGSSYIDYGTILDENGDPFDLGPTISPQWTLEAQLRLNVADRASAILASFAVSVLDGPLGQVSWSLTPAQSLALSYDQDLAWDFDATNVSHPDFDVGWRATVWYGTVRIFRDVTRS